MATILELREKRNKLLADARAIRDRADKDNKRALTTEEVDQVNKILAEHRTVGEELKTLETRSDLDAEIAKAEEEARTSRGRKTSDDTPDGERQRDKPGDDKDRNEALRARFAEWTLRNSGGKRRIPMSGRIADEAYRTDFRNFLRTGRATPALVAGDEKRDLQADSGADGGYLVAPMQMAAGLIKFVDDLVFMRQFATVMQVTGAQNLGAVSLDADPDDGEWTGELTTGTADSAMKFGRRELNPAPLAKLIKISRKLARLVPDIEALVTDRLAYKFGITQEKNFLTGNGANKPLGIFTAHASGISTGRDLSTGNTTTAITADNLIRNKMNLKAQYRGRPSTRWMFHRSVLTTLMLLKDGNGQYLWRQGLAAGEPDTLLGVQVAESEYAPSTLTTGLYVGIIGDFSFYWIAESLRMEIQVLDQLYAATNQLGYIGRMELDGMPVLEEAFSRVKLA